MEKTKVFTIMKHSNGKYSIILERNCTYNKYDVPASKLFDEMQEITSTFNNVFNIAVLFEIG
jgi:hypothetical protein